MNTKKKGKAMTKGTTMEDFNKELEQEINYLKKELETVKIQRDDAEKNLADCEMTMKDMAKSFNAKVSQIEKEQSNNKVTEQDRLMYIIKVLFAMLRDKGESNN